MFERFTDRARRVVILAQEEARLLNHDYIGTEHLLLGLISETDGLAAKALESLGISPQAIRDKVSELVGKGKQPASGHIPFTAGAKHVLELALRESLQLGVDYIGTEHILLGLAREADGVGAKVLTSLGADLNGVRQHVIELLPVQSGSDPADPAQPAGLRARARRFESASSPVVALGRRITALEQWAGLTPDLTDIDEQVAHVRRDKEAAIQRQDFEGAAELRNKERDLLAERSTKAQEWTAGPSLADEVRRLRDEVGRLRSVLHEHGIDPGDAA